MSKLADVLAAIDDFRSQLFVLQNSDEAILTPKTAVAGLRGMLGDLVSPLQNVHATGVGIRIKAGKLLPTEFVIKVYVFNKLTGISALLPKLLDKPFHGVEIDIEELPVLSVRGKKAAGGATTPTQHQARRRPVIGGIEVQPIGASFVGTLGGFVKSTQAASNVIFALSNNHVLADTNQMPIGKEITQAASRSSTDIFAKLTAFEPIQLATPSNPFPARNRLDAAIARVTDTSLIRTKTMLGISNYTPTLKSPTPGMPVTKSGRTTGVTKGTVTAIRVNGVRVNYGTPSNPIIGTFDGCIQVAGAGGKPFSAGGDSGSFILEQSTGQPVALLFAGNTVSTTACDLTAVCTRFNVVPT